MVEERRKFVSGYDRVGYYDKILKDLRNDNENTGTSNNFGKYLAVKFRSAIKKMTDARNKIYLLLCFYYVLYGQQNNEYWSIMKVYRGLKEQIDLYDHVKDNVTKREIPPHYVKAMEYFVKKSSERCLYLDTYFDSLKEITPLTKIPYETIIKDIEEYFHASFEDSVRLNTFDDMIKFFDIYSEKYGYKGLNEMREYYDNIMSIKINRAIKIKEKEKEDKRKKRIEEANETAAKLSNRVYSLIYTDAYSCYKLIEKAKTYKKPRIFIFVSTVKRNASNCRIKYLNSDGKLIYDNLNDSQVFEDDGKIPEQIQQLLDTGNYGYTEIAIPV